LLAFAVRNIELQQTVTTDHAVLGHYGFMAAFSVTVIGTGLVATLRPVGSRLTAWVVGFLPALLGLTSLVYPNNDSSLSRFWAVAAIAWGIGFVAVSENTRDAKHEIVIASRRGSTGKTPRWVYVGAIAVVLLLLFLVLHLAGRGPGLH
jgi:hypothetical protein